MGRAWHLPVTSGGARPRDAGAAAVEFATLGVLLLIPLVYLVVTVGRIQAGSLAAQSAARAASRSMTAADTDGQGRARASLAADLAITDQGFDPGSATLRLRCTRAPCLTPGAQVEAQVTVTVPLPGVPAFVRHAVPLEVIVQAAQLAAVDEFRASGRP